MTKTIRQACVMLFMMTMLTGVIYPLAVTLIAQAVFPHQANGSMIRVAGHNVGSELIGQEFTSARYFFGRPSASADHPYNAAASGGSNYGPINSDLLRDVSLRTEALLKERPDLSSVPSDLVTASASGLDPHISAAAALFQVKRVAAARGLDPVIVTSLVHKHTEQRAFGFLGEPRVNVLNLNLALDAVK